MDEGRATTIRAFEAEAELLVVHHLDLIALIEAQLRAIHHTMRRIERLRRAKDRVGAELSNGDRQTVLAGLSAEVAALDQHLAEEHESCMFMQDTIALMQQRLTSLKHAAVRLEHESGRESPDQGGSLGA